jgi:hypothetical protein
MGGMKTPADFHIIKGNSISYDGVTAGEHVAGLVAQGLAAAQQLEYVDILRLSRHVIEEGYFDEETSRFRTFTWNIYASTEMYLSVSTAALKASFVGAIKQLQLRELDDVTDIFVLPETASTEDWRERAGEAVARGRKTISLETLTAFTDVIAANATLRVIRAAFENAGFTEGTADKFEGGERRTLFWNFMANVEQARPNEAQRLASALWSMIETMLEQRGTSVELEKIANRLEREGFPDDQRSELLAAPPTQPKAVSISAEAATTPLIDEVITFLRAVPRGIDELSEAHRHAKRNYGFIKIVDEYDLQDFVRAFLRMRFPRANVENPVGQVAGKSGRVDFSLGGEKIFIELKMITAEEQWNKAMYADVTSKFERYSRDAACDHLIVFIYNPNNALRTGHAIEADMTMRREMRPQNEPSKTWAYYTHVVVEPKF